MKTIERTQTYCLTNCFDCGVSFGMTEGLYDQRVLDGKSFYCPNGHSQRFVESVKERLRKARVETLRALEDKNYWKNVSQQAEKREAAQKGVVTRLKNRLSKGVCPHCKKYFKNLHRHMESKHKEEETK